MVGNNIVMKNVMMAALWYFPYEFRRLLFRAARPQSYKNLQEMRKIDTDEGYSLKPFDEHRCIFIHIPKCAGVSVCKSLFGNLAAAHMNIGKYQLAFSKREFENYFKFTFVRNPWDRLVSSYFFLKEGGMTKWDRMWAEQNLSSYVDFESFVKGWLNRRNLKKWFHFTPQYKFICEPGSSEPKVDFIGFFENLAEDFSHVQKRLGFKSSLMDLNKTRTRERDYREYYTKATREIVSNVYREDIQTFGYDFDNLSLEKQLSKRYT